MAAELRDKQDGQVVEADNVDSRKDYRRAAGGYERADAERAGTLPRRGSGRATPVATPSVKPQPDSHHTKKEEYIKNKY